MDYEFKSLEELYNRIKPALRSKAKEFLKIGMSHVKEADIWNFLTQNKWKNAKGLSLSVMIEDIFNIDYDEVNNYVIKKLKEENREPSFLE